MDTAEIVGSCAATLTTVAFFPQVMRTWRTKKADDISLGWLVSFFAGIVLWFVYGMMIGSLPIILANGITVGLVGVILWVKLASLKRGA